MSKLKRPNFRSMLHSNKPTERETLELIKNKTIIQWLFKKPATIYKYIKFGPFWFCKNDNTKINSIDRLNEIQHVLDWFKQMKNTNNKHNMNDNLKTPDEKHIEKLEQAVSFYANEASSLAKYLKLKKYDAFEATVKVLELDAGNRAKKLGIKVL